MKNLLIIFLLNIWLSAYSVVKTSTSNGNWNSAGTWSPSGVPGSNDTVIINSGHNIDENLNNAACKRLIISGQLRFSSVTNFTVGVGGIQLNNGSSINGVNFSGIATGRLTNNGPLIVPTGATASIGRMRFTQNGITQISGTLDWNNTRGAKRLADITVNSGGTWLASVNEAFTISGNLTVNGTFTPNTATYLFNGVNKTLSGTATITFSTIDVTGTLTNNLKIITTNGLTGSGTWSQGNNGELTIQHNNFTIASFNASSSNNTVSYTRNGNLTIPMPNDGAYFHLSLSGNGTKSLPAPLAVGGNLTIASGTTLDVTNSNHTLTIGGNWQNSGTFNSRSGNVTFNGNNPQTITKSGGETFFGVVFSGSGLKTLANPILVNSNLSINSGASISVGSGNNQITIKGNWVNNGTFSGGTGLVLFNGTANQSISGSSTSVFYDLTQQNSAGVTQNGPVNIQGTLQLNSGTYNVNGQTLTLISTASLSGRIGPIAASANITGNVTVQRFAPGGTTGWAFLGAPITSSLTYLDWNDDFPISCSSCPNGSAGGFLSIYTYHEPASGTRDDPASYIPLTSINNPINIGRGYWVYLGNGQFSTSNITIDVTGSVGKFNTTIPLTRTNTGSPNDDGWNLIANPYPSPISWSALKGTTANIDDAIYVYNADLNGGAGGYASFVNGISSPAVGSGGIGNTIPACQGFYVHSTGATSLLARESHKVSGNPTFLKTGTQNPAITNWQPLLRLNLNGPNNYNDETVVYFDSAATSSFDPTHDAYKNYSSDPNAPNIFSVMANTEMVINSLPDFSNVVIPIKIKTGTSGTYSISPIGISSFPNGVCITLFDKFTGITTDLRSGGYGFYYYDTTTVPRFELSFVSSALSATVSTIQPDCQHPSGGEIIAVGTNGGPWNYLWKDAFGNIIKSSVNKPTADTLSGIAGGLIDLSINTAGTCDNYFNSIQLNSVQLVSAGFSIPDTIDLATGGWVNVLDLSSGAGSWFWNFGDGSPVLTGSNPVYSYSTTGNFLISQVVYSPTGCFDSVAKSITVVNSGLTSISNPLLTNFQFVQTDNQIGVTNIADDGLYGFTVFTVDGRVIYKSEILESGLRSWYFNTSVLANGIYYLRIIDQKNSKLVLKKFIISR